MSIESVGRRSGFLTGRHRRTETTGRLAAVVSFIIFAVGCLPVVVASDLPVIVRGLLAVVAGSFLVTGLDLLRTRRKSKALPSQVREVLLQDPAFAYKPRRKSTVVLADGRRVEGVVIAFGTWVSARRFKKLTFRPAEVTRVVPE